MTHIAFNAAFNSARTCASVNTMRQLTHAVFHTYGN